MSEQIDAFVEGALAAKPVQDVQVAPTPVLHPRVASNIVEFLKRVQVTGIEAFALAEAIATLQSFAGPAPTGPGVPFPGVGG